ncbi:MAG TPA: HAD-IB family hydrolase [Acidimicrobiales bacterium]|nr:HAD-IB family hydrolase [Acidimicrobiales bacterium]
MVTARSPQTHVHNGSAGPDAGGTPPGAVFVDLDRTLLRGASGLVLGAAMHAEGLFEGRMSLPGERLLYGLYDVMGESLAFMGMVRLAPRFARGWAVEAVCRAGELAAPELADLVQPYAPGVLAEHREAGRLLVLTTTTPHDLVTAFASLLGFDHVLATRYARRDGIYTGGIDGPFVWSAGKLAAVRRWASDTQVDLGASHAYSDSVFDLPLLGAVGHPHAVNPDRRLRAVARLRRWPVERWDKPRGVPKLGGLEPYDLLRPVVRPALFPYARFDLDGVSRIPARGPVILAANHRSYFDVVALALVAARLGRPVRFLAKRELFDAPVVGPVARALGGIPVDRGTRSDAPLRQARRALEAGEVVIVLPQGTIPRGRAFFDPVLVGKSGTARLAAMTGAPVVPVGLWGTEVVWPRSSRLPDVTTVLRPPRIQVCVGRAVHLGLTDVTADTEAIMSAIAAQLPAEAARVREPTPEELARTFPPGRAEAPPDDATRPGPT